MQAETSRLRIGLRVFSSASWMGGVNYVLSWARALSMLPVDERPHVTLLFAEENGLAIAREHRSLVDAIAPFADAHKLGLDFVYPATQIAEAPFGAPWAAWIPDWQCKHLPEMFDVGEIARRDLTYSTLARSAPLAVLSSDMAIADTQRFVGGALAPLRRLHFPAVPDDSFYTIDPADIAEARARYGLPERYFLVCNQFWRHKNHKLVFEALALCAEDGVVCAFTGATSDPRWPEHFPQVERLVAESGIADRVHILGRIDRRDQLLLLVGAVAAVQPSRFEGWNTMIEECRALGIQVVASDFPVHREQSPPESRFVGLDDAAGLARELTDLWRNPPARSDPGSQKERHAEHVRASARQFLAIAAETRSAYDPERHDPPIVMASMLSSLTGRDGPSDDEIRESLRQRTTAVVRAALKDRPEALASFMAAVMAKAPAYLADARRQIEVPVLAMMDKAGRRDYPELARLAAPPPGSVLVARLLGRAKRFARRFMKRS